MKAQRAGVSSWDGRKIQVWTRTSPPRFVGSVAVDLDARDWRGRAARGVGDLVRRPALLSAPLVLVPFPPVRGARALRNASGAWSSTWWLPFPASTITDPSHDAWRMALLREQRARRAADRCDLEVLRAAVLYELRGASGELSLRDLRRRLRSEAHAPGFVGRLLREVVLLPLLEQAVESGAVVRSGGDPNTPNACRWRAAPRKVTPSTSGAGRDGDAR